MARARNIKPSFFKNEELVELPFETRLLFIGLWTMADRAGLLEDRPKRIKMEIFPGDDVDVEKSLRELGEAGFIHRYTVAKDRFIQVCNFLKHQNPHHKEAASKIPKPRADPGQAQGSDSVDGGKNPVPAVLIPDSLIPDSKALSGKPDAAPVNGRDYKGEAREVLDYLNRNSGRNFRPVDATLKPIIARLKSGVTPLQAKEVVFAKCEQWKTDAKMATYLRPETLFNATKFESYLGEMNG